MERAGHAVGHGDEGKAGTAGRTEKRETSPWRSLGIPPGLQLAPPPPLGLPNRSKVQSAERSGRRVSAVETEKERGTNDG